MSDASTTVTHLVALTWKDGTTPEQVEAFRTAILEFAGRMDGVVSYRAGSDLGITDEGNSSFGIVGTFTDAASYEKYRDHADHLAIIDELVKPILAHRCAAQI